MRIEGDTLHAKTGVGFFEEEKWGVKPFTVQDRKSTRLNSSHM